MLTAKSDEVDDSLAKINSRYHFQSQVVFSIDSEPLAICVAGDSLLIANVAHCVEVRNLDCHGKCSHTFCTVDLVKQILYSDVGQYVATLEVKTSRHSLMTHVRLYFNWQVDTKGLPMRARIAGRVTPSSQSAVGQLEMVELPLQKQACYVSCCKSTGNLAVSCGFSISVFHFCIKIHDISKLEFHDLEHLMEIYFTFPAKEIALCEDFLACMSANEVHVVCVDFKTSSNEIAYKKPLAENDNITDTFSKSNLKKSNISKEEFTTEEPCKSIDDPNFVSWNSTIATSSWSTLGDDGVLQELGQHLHSDSLPLTIHLPSLNQQAIYVEQSNLSMERTGPVDYFPGHPVKLDYTGVLNVGNNFAPLQFNTTSLVYKRFSLPLPNSSDYRFCLHSLQFLPFYISDIKQDNDENCQGAALHISWSSTGNPFHSQRRHLLKHLEIFFSAPNEGFLYSLLGEVYKISSYTYSHDIFYATVENNVLHGVRSHGVETHSVGHWERILQYFDNDSIVQGTLWHPSDPYAVVLGTSPFFNIRLASSHNGHLALLTSTTDTAPLTEKWTAYSLQWPLVEEFYKDLVHGCDDTIRSDVTEPECDMLRYLLHEAHSALAFEVLLNRPPSSSRLSQLFQEACCRLGNLYLCSEDEKVSSAAFFYKMSKCPLEIILRKVFVDHQCPEKRMCSLLSLIFIEDNFSNEVNLSKEIANTIIHMFSSADQMKIPLLILKGHFTGYDPALALEHIQNSLANKTSSIEDTVATWILYSQCGRIEKIPSSFTMVSNESLLKLTKEYPNVWVSSNTDTLTFSPLLQVIQQIQPNIFAKIMKQLFVEGHVAVKTLSILCQTDWEEYGLSVQTDTIMLLLLEELLANKGTRCSSSIEAVLTLVSLYLKYVGHPKASSILPVQTKAWHLYGPRHSWLNDLPPFMGNSINKPCRALTGSCDSSESEVEKVEDVLCTQESCPCLACNDCLLRLQSLLCSDLATVEVQHKVTAFVAKASSLAGALSLQVLCCSSVSAATDLLISHFPSGLLEYCRDVFGMKSCLWNKLLSTLLEKLEDENLNNDMKQSVNKNINGVVALLAEIVSPTELVILLPVGPNDRFLPYVKRCIAKHQAKQLGDIIITKGYELKALV